MAYQLRFLKTSPIGSWLNLTASILEVLIPNPDRSFYPPRRQHFRRIRKTLIKGLLTFLVKRSMCDLGLDDCDEELAPVPENKSPDRFEEGTINGPVKRYMFRKDIDLSGAIQNMTLKLMEEMPEAAREKEKLGLVLKESLASHLFENPKCYYRTICRHSHQMELSGELADLRRHCPIPSHGKTS